MSHAYTNLLLHVVYSTKDRVPFLADRDVRLEMHAYLGGIINNQGGRAIAMGGVEDHVHLLFAASKNVLLPDLIRDIKRNSNVWLKKKSPRYEAFSWQGSYAAFSVGQLEVPVIRKYIEGQEERHKKQTFQEEYRAMLKRYGIEGDERYMWG